LLLDPSTRGGQDVAHAVIAVGSRDKQKATEFIAKHMPSGTWAQQAGLVKALPEPFGSYEDVWGHSVNIAACSPKNDIDLLVSRMWILSMLELPIQVIMNLRWVPYKLGNMYFVKRSELKVTFAKSVLISTALACDLECRGSRALGQYS
jgi:hypothetical protein